MNIVGWWNRGMRIWIGSLKYRIDIKGNVAWFPGSRGLFHPSCHFLLYPYPQLLIQSTLSNWFYWKRWEWLEISIPIAFMQIGAFEVIAKFIILNTLKFLLHNLVFDRKPNSIFFTPLFASDQGKFILAWDQYSPTRNAGDSDLT